MSPSSWSAATPIRRHRNGFAGWGRTLTSPNHILPPPCGKRWSGYCMRRRRHRLELIFALLAPLVRVQAQSPPELQQILDRLNRLESENRELREQVRELREQMRELREQMRPVGTPAPVQKLEE